MAISYIAYASVPLLREARMSAFFLCLSLTSGGIALYNGLWQNFFASVVDLRMRNDAYTFRNIFMFTINMIIPLTLGVLLSGKGDSESRLPVFRMVFYICAALMLLQFFVLLRIPCPPQASDKAHFSLAVFQEALHDMRSSRRFCAFFAAIAFMYVGWHFDGSLWYIAQVNYVGMTQSQISFNNALNGIALLAGMGIFTRLINKKSIHYVFIFSIGGLVLCSLGVFTVQLLPMHIRPVFFIINSMVGNLPQCASNLCITQMLLEVVPQRNRALIINLYTLFVTADGCIMPMLAVQLYLLLGGNVASMMIVNSISFALRLTAMGVFILRYQRFKQSKDQSSIHA